MKKLTTTMMQETLNKQDRHLTVGLDLGDKSSFYCVLDEAGEVLMEQRLGTTPKAMARHLGVAASTLSAGLSRLAAGGFVTVTCDSADARRRIVMLTDLGRAALAADSVLDPDRVARLLLELGDAERARAVEGLTSLAQAARKMREKGG